MSLAGRLNACGRGKFLVAKLAARRVFKDRPGACWKVVSLLVSLTWANYGNLVLVDCNIEIASAL